MPELPEAERARLTLESVLGRRIAHVDDGDTYVCRPHPPGEIAAALVGHEFVSARRRGKFLWMQTADGPTLGLHLGMAGHIALDPPADRPRWDR
ncbi:MAG: DNA-formamidopyrimidine glycosylase family protein, partial [Solirubrobacteraceae bacterium]